MPKIHNITFSLRYKLNALVTKIFVFLLDSYTDPVECGWGNSDKGLRESVNYEWDQDT